MKILILGAGVIGTVYGWQLSEVGHDISVLVRKGKKEILTKDGFEIHYTDERQKPKKAGVIHFQPTIVDDWSSQDGYELIIVCVRAHQLEQLLPKIAESIGAADVLFFQNNWWGDRLIKQFLPDSQFLFGFSRLVGGWRNDNNINCILFDAPGLVTMLGEKGGRQTPRLQKLVVLFRQANLKPEISRDILGWLATHYVEFLGAVGAILEAGSARKFSEDTDLVRAAILATREGLDVCRARGIDVSRAAPINLRLYSFPMWLLLPLARMNYRMANIQQFLDENIATGILELTHQYYDVIGEGKKLGVAMPSLNGFERSFAEYRDESQYLIQLLAQNNLIPPYKEVISLENKNGFE
jgi:ketopantoate reductase